MKHSERARFPVDDLRLAYAGRRYSGHGLLAWDPDQGFELDARLELSRGERPSRVSIGPGPFVLPIATLVMQVQGIGRALAQTPHYLSRVHDLRGQPFWQHITFDRARFVRNSGPTGGELCFASYEYPAGAPLLPEVIFTSRKLGEKGAPLDGWKRAGLRAFVGGTEISGMLEGTSLDLAWALDTGRPSTYRRRASAIETALTAIATKPIPLLRYEILMPNRVEEEVRRRPRHSPIVAAGLIGGTDTLKPSEFETLVACLEQSSVESLVVRKTVWAVMNAFQHRTDSAIDLAVATTLEGALRTLEDRNDKKWKLKKALEWFRVNRGLPEDWKAVHAEVEGIYARLRMQHAHPFWRRSARPSHAQGTESLARRNRLIRYLGMLIRVLAKMPVEPELPQLRVDPISN